MPKSRAPEIWQGALVEVSRLIHQTLGPGTEINRHYPTTTLAILEGFLAIVRGAERDFARWQRDRDGQNRRQARWRGKKKAEGGS